MSESRARSASVHRLEFPVDWPPGHVACYLLVGDEPVLVDAGMPTGDDSPHDREATFREGVRAAGIEVADIEHVLLTHPHYDHVGQVSTVVEEATPTVWAPAGVRERFDRDADALGERVRANASEAGISGALLDTAVEMAVESLERDRDHLPPDAIDRTVAGGETVTVGGHELTATHAPGHQAEHLCYLTELDGEAALLSGDMAMEPFRGIAIHDGLDDGVFDAIDAFYGGLERLAALEVDRVYPGHGPVHADFDRVVARDRDSLDRRLAGVEDALSDGLRTVPGIAMQVAGDRPVRYILPEVVAAAAYLAETGRATATVEDGVRYYDPA